MQQYAPILQKVLLFGLFFILIFEFSYTQVFHHSCSLGGNYCLYDLAPVSISVTYVWQSPDTECDPDDSGRDSGIRSSVYFAIFMLQHEGRNLYMELQRQVFSGHLNVPDFIRGLPIVGKEISLTLNEINTDPQSIALSVSTWIQGHLNYGKVVLNEVSKIYLNYVLPYFRCFSSTVMVRPF